MCSLSVLNFSWGSGLIPAIISEMLTHTYETAMYMVPILLTGSKHAASGYPQVFQNYCFETKAESRVVQISACNERFEVIFAWVIPPLPDVLAS